VRVTPIVGVETSLGATCLGKRSCRFRVWAPFLQRLELHLLTPEERLVPMEPTQRGYHQIVVDDCPPGSFYFYRLNGKKERPDPASRFQPQGVHGPSQVTDLQFDWTDNGWFGLPLENYIVYELHVGTFTSEGTFDAMIPHLPRLRDLGITALEIMPVAQFPGNRNWGYDGVYPFAVQDSYGGPTGLKRLVNACHNHQLAVILDVVYNHLGPEGNYLAEFGPYFTERYKTPWGWALNFDGAHSDEVREFFIENALYWITEFHIDALRLDAVHAILDHSPRTFLEELSAEVHRQAKRINRQVYLMPESASNDARLIRSRELGGYGLDAQWNDDFHHSLHVLLTGERTGYYTDYGRIEHLVKALREGFVYSGEYSSYRRRRHGSSSRDIPAHRFVVFAQNHDQVGNRMGGERLSQLVSLESLKLAAGLVLLSPFIPLLFMGEEYGETAPFQYFTSHADPNLIEAVRQGRREEFAAFQWKGEPPDPQDEATFLRAKLNHKLGHEGQNQILSEFYQELIRLRKGLVALARLDKESMDVVGHEKEQLLVIRRWSGDDEVFIAFYLGADEVSISFALPAGQWRKVLDSEDGRWQGKGSSLPAQMNSDGEILLRLKPKSFFVLSTAAEV
jgi:maltooligosyltrehalose trehalohydrolase